MMTMMMMTQFNQAETRMGMSLATAASPQPFFRVPWRMGDAVVGRGNAGLTTLKEWTSLPMPELLTRVSCRKDWKRISAESSLKSPRRPSWSRDWPELNSPIRATADGYVSLNIKMSLMALRSKYTPETIESHIFLCQLTAFTCPRRGTADPEMKAPYATDQDVNGLWEKERLKHV